MSAQRKYPIGLQSFQEIREEGYVYVDKTAEIYNLVTYGAKTVFLSRPRRFGKTLLCSTLHAYFEGKKELFDGLSISRMESKWTKHPVMSISFAGFKGSSIDELNQWINLLLTDYEKQYEVEVITTTPATRLVRIVKTMAEVAKERPVVLIDEYDTPLLNVIGNDEALDALRETLQAFYAPLKQLEPSLRFLFITGVTKFSQVSIFSTLNNLDNLSLIDQYSSICGITLDEMMSQMEPDVRALSEAIGKSLNDTVDTLRVHYNGYKFSANSPEILNPYSLMKCFQWKKFKDFWFESGTSGYLVRMLKKYNVQPSQIGAFEAREADFDTPTERIINIVPLLYQSGYLTIKGYNPEVGKYYLDIPNLEVRIGLMDQLIPNYITNPVLLRNEIADIVLYISKGEIKLGLEKLKSFFKTVPYCANIDYEGHWQQMMYVVFSLFGAYADVEVHTAKGRVDMAMIYKNKLYLWELKLNSTAKSALAQINRNAYSSRFQRLSLPIVKIGLAFSTKRRTISSFLIEE
ncbi:MAG: ATP-binding protein [Bacteroidales bacterium]|nr:ATP-binding protein [Bacteroidales bacterium]